MATSVPGDASLRWGPCTRRHYDHTYQCSTLTVPLDHTGAAPGTLDIALIRTPAKDAKHRIGSLLINPGGPGGSALADWDFLSGQVDGRLHDRFDVVGFDPRGVGDSTQIRCTDGAGLDAYSALDFSPTTPRATDALLATSRSLAQGCVSRSGRLLPYIGTADAARDMDAIRAALGDAKLSYLGFSYGTFLGATYAEEFPTHVRALVLDGALDPALPPVAAADAQSVGFQRQVDRFLADCAGRRDCAWHIQGDPHAALRALLDRIDADPLPAGGRQLHSGQAFFGIGITLYDQRDWPTLADALGRAADGDGTALLRLSDAYTERSPDGTYSNSVEANLAIDCRDAAWPRDQRTFLADARAAAARAPDFGQDNLNLTLACASFPAKDSGGPAHALRAAGAPPILVVATTGDPATPYADGVALARQLASGVLLTNVGEQHTAYGYSACTRRIADDYLLSGTAPAAGQRCDDE